jgi:hypothetical protein
VACDSEDSVVAASDCVCDLIRSCDDGDEPGCAETEADSGGCCSVTAAAPGAGDPERLLKPGEAVLRPVCAGSGGAPAAEAPKFAGAGERRTMGVRSRSGSRGPTLFCERGRFVVAASTSL